jgi:hypothetical protein
MIAEEEEAAAAPPEEEVPDEMYTFMNTEVVGIRHYRGETASQPLSFDPALMVIRIGRSRGRGSPGSGTTQPLRPECYSSEEH